MLKRSIPPAEELNAHRLPEDMIASSLARQALDNDSGRKRKEGENKKREEKKGNRSLCGESPAQFQAIGLPKGTISQYKRIRSCLST